VSAATVVARSPKATVMVVDDEPSMLRYLQTLLEVKSYAVETAVCGEELLERLEHRPLPDLVLLDMVMPGMDGLQTLEHIRKDHPDLKVIMLSCVTDVAKVVQAVRLGAFDYLAKPFQKAELDAVMQRCIGPVSQPAAPPKVSVENIQLSDETAFVAASPSMHRVRSKATLIAEHEIPVLILGESGTGKEVLALLIHRLSRRAERPFLKVNCAALPSDLLESELFGYEQGAFTGATKAKPGKFELCDGGTILLDEIGEMAPALQAKLLHVLQDNEISRLGGRVPMKVDGRVLAATNIDIQEAIASKKFREDLYYRLNAFTMHLPPLRERKEEIPVLLEHFMKRQAKAFGRPALTFSTRLLRACIDYGWPGNVRELQNFVKRYLIFGHEETAMSELQALDIHRPADQVSGPLKSVARSAKGDAEARMIARALEETDWHRGKAAAILKISYKALLYKIRQYGLTPPARHQHPQM
jgi:two-component system, NtrC family, response regulator AtoC